MHEQTQRDLLAVFKLDADIVALVNQATNGSVVEMHAARLRRANSLLDGIIRLGWAVCIDGDIVGEMGGHDGEARVARVGEFEDTDGLALFLEAVAVETLVTVRITSISNRTINRHASRDKTIHSMDGPTNQIDGQYLHVGRPVVLVSLNIRRQHVLCARCQNQLAPAIRCIRAIDELVAHVAAANVNVGRLLNLRRAELDGRVLVHLLVRNVAECSGILAVAGQDRVHGANARVAILARVKDERGAVDAAEGEGGREACWAAADNQCVKDGRAVHFV